MCFPSSPCTDETIKKPPDSRYRSASPLFYFPAQGFPKTFGAHIQSSASGNLERYARVFFRGSPSKAEPLLSRRFFFSTRHGFLFPPDSFSTQEKTSLLLCRRLPAPFRATLLFLAGSREARPFRCGTVLSFSPPDLTDNFPPPLSESRASRCRSTPLFLPGPVSSQSRAAFLPLRIDRSRLPWPSRPPTARFSSSLFRLPPAEAAFFRCSLSSAGVLPSRRLSPMRSFVFFLRVLVSSSYAIGVFLSTVVRSSSSSSFSPPSLPGRAAGPS